MNTCLQTIQGLRHIVLTEAQYLLFAGGSEWEIDRTVGHLLLLDFENGRVARGFQFLAVALQALEDPAFARFDRAAEFLLVAFARLVDTGIELDILVLLKQLDAQLLPARLRHSVLLLQSMQWVARTQRIIAYRFTQTRNHLRPVSYKQL